MAIMKKFFALLLVLLLFIPSCLAEQQDFQFLYHTYQGKLTKNDQFVYFDMGNGSVAIASYIGKDKTVDIGAVFPDQKEILILAWAFTYEANRYCGQEMYLLDGQRYECKTKVKKVILPENAVIRIDHDAFDNTTLSEINIPANVAEIGEAAFSNCSFSELPDIPQQLTLPRGIFYGGSQKKLTVPSCYTELPEMCFWASSTNEYILSETLKSIGNSCFESSQLKKITLPSGLTAIGEKAFKSCGKLASVILPDTLEVISPHAFEDCSALNKITIPYGVKKIDEFAFCACKKLKSISLPASVSEIADSAFAEVPSITFTVLSGSYAETWARNAGYKVKVIKPVTNIELNESALTVACNKTATIKAIVTPKEANNKKVEWISTNPAVATVRQGKVKGITPGTCDIICNALDGSGIQAICHITVE